MFVTLKVEIDGEPFIVTFEGTADQCNAKMRGFLGDGMQVTSIQLWR